MQLLPARPIRRARAAASTALLVALAAALLAANAPAPQDEPPSLERLLRRARAEEAALLARLGEPVRQVVLALEAAEEAEALERAREDLLELGPAAAPLVVPHLAPGPDPTEASLRRSAAVAAALSAWRAPGVVEELVQLARGDDPRARQRAAAVLSHVASSDRARARGVLSELLASSEPGARLDAARGLATMARLGDPKSVEPLRALLAEESASLVREALDALAAVEVEEAEPEVRQLATDAQRALAVLGSLEGYYRAVDGAPREAFATALVRTCQASGLSLEARQAFLRTVAALDPSLDRDLKEAFEPLLEHASPQVRDEALIAMTLLGDRGAKRDLTRKYDELVQRRPEWPDVYEDRAGIQVRIGDYDGAIDDYETAIELARVRSWNNTVPREMYVLLARAQCLDGKLRQAHDSLRKAYPSEQRLQELREDPAFAELVEHSRYGRFFDGE